MNCFVVHAKRAKFQIFNAKDDMANVPGRKILIELKYVPLFSHLSFTEATVFTYDALPAFLLFILTANLVFALNRAYTL